MSSKFDVLTKPDPPKPASSADSESKPEALSAAKERRRGKSADPDFVQSTFYIPRALRQRIQLHLLMLDDGRDASEWAAEAFEAYLRSTEQKPST